MKEIIGDLFSVEADAICITTNGFVKTNGSLVMGRGVAKQLCDKYKGIDQFWGYMVSTEGNHVHPLSYFGNRFICSFPVKHDWWEKADIDLIVRSSTELVDISNKFKWFKVLLPKPGCGNGRLKWEDVKKVIEPILDDRFYIIDKEVV